MSRKTKFATYTHTTKNGQVKVELTFQGLKFDGGLIVTPEYLWDALVELLISVPKNTTSLGLARRREEAMAALRQRLKTLECVVICQT